MGKSGQKQEKSDETRIKQEIDSIVENIDAILKKIDAAMPADPSETEENCQISSSDESDGEKKA